MLSWEKNGKVEKSILSLKIVIFWTFLLKWQNRFLYFAIFFAILFIWSKSDKRTALSRHNWCRSA
jgi:hypothetical protein